MVSVFRNGKRPRPRREDLQREALRSGVLAMTNSRFQQLRTQIECPNVTSLIIGKSEDAFSGDDGIGRFPVRRFCQLHGAAVDPRDLPFRPAGPRRRIDMTASRHSHRSSRAAHSKLLVHGLRVQSGSERQNGYRQERV